MANETFPLSKPIEVLNPVSNLDYDYGPYNTVAEALSALAEIGLVGRPFAVFKDETKKTVDFFLIGEDGNGNKIAVPTEGGGAKFPEAGNSGDILEKDDTTAEGAKWSDRLTTAENEIDAEVVNRAAEDLAEKNARIAGDNYLLDQLATESTNRANADLLKQDKSMFSALVDKWVHFYNGTTLKFEAILKHVAGVVNQLEYDGRIKMAAAILPPNTSPAIPNRFWSDGTYLFYDNGLAVTKRFPYVENIPTQDKLAAVTSTGSIKPLTFSYGAITKLYGEDNTGTAVFAEAVQFKSVSTSNTPPTALELIAFGTDRVDYQNLNRIYFNYGSKWGYITLTEVTT